MQHLPAKSQPTRRGNGARTVRFGAILVATVAVAAACASASDSVSQPASVASSPSPTSPTSPTAGAAAGSLNPKFVQTGTGLNQPVDAVTTVAAGSGGDDVVVGGRFTTYNGTARSYVARLNSDGSLDGGFTQTATGLNGRVRAVAAQTDGKVLVGGEFTAYNSTSVSYLARLNTDGSLDEGFVPPPLNKAVWGITVQPDGKILIGGLFQKTATTPGYVMRLNADGSADSAFKGTNMNGYVKTTAVQTDGKILVGGSFTAPRTNLARLNADGTLDTSFAPKSTGLDAKGYLDQVIVAPDGKVLIGGWFTAYDGTDEPRVARLNSDGTLDPSFAAQGGGLNAEVKSMALQQDGKIVVGGDFTQYGSTPAQSVARLSSDGSLDTSFVQTGNGLSSNVNSLALTSTGEVVVGGAFTAYDATAINYAAELLGAPGPTPTVPSAPQSVTAVAGAKGTITVTWKAPASVGASPITSYQATATDKDIKTKNTGSCTADGTALTCTMKGVKGGGPQYEVTVTATNTSGTGPASSPPADVTPK